ncbi:hypothetical protein [Mesorhizobium neociceri]|uniref:hypothetical protein n=1 Tax=Mesorhizobium neociceri TaxID=1307853 RepID=UPI0015E2890E|nr:hypothetical protein [Mesorhizobium neociceri]
MPHVLILQDGKAQKQRTKFVSQERVYILGRGGSRGVLLHPGDRLIHSVEIGSEQG